MCRAARSGSLRVELVDVHGPHTRSNGLQRFFSTFPDGWPAAGLLLLRGVAGVASAGLGGAFLANTPEPTVASWALGAVAILSGLGLVAGFLTPGAAAAAGVSTLLIAWIGPLPIVLGLRLDGSAAALVVIDAIALAMLGPGAHSVDAHLFGRREIIIPDHSRRRPVE
jgi:putative oxidoreductase